MVAETKFWKHYIICQRTNAKQVRKLAWCGQTEPGFIPLLTSSLTFTHHGQYSKYLFSAHQVSVSVLSTWHAVYYLIFIRAYDGT